MSTTTEETKRYKASHKYARISPRKARYVADLVRGKSANEASFILQSLTRRAAPMIKKVLDSAIANAKDQGAQVNSLTVDEVKIDGGPTLKRYRPGPMGRAMRIRKRTCHISLSLSEVEVEEKEKEKDKES